MFMQLRKCQQPAKNFTKCVSNAVHTYRDRKPLSHDNYHVNYSFFIHFIFTLFYLNACTRLITLSSTFPFRCHFQYKLFVVENVINQSMLLKKYQQRVKNGIKHVLNVVRCRSYANPFLS
jgi:hypothetical protein